MTGLSKSLNVIATLLLLIIGAAFLANRFALLDIPELLSGRESMMGFVGAGMLLLSLIVIFFAIKNVRPEQTISIQNPEGEVRITFSAIEELLRKASHEIKGVKELKPRVIATKKGLEVLNRVSIEGEVSIPQVTMRIQELIKAQLKDILGIEEVGAIRTFVNKIVTEEHPKHEESETT